ncbi:unnamed protein product [Urochloa humidicola]
MDNAQQLFEEMPPRKLPLCSMKLEHLPFSNLKHQWKYGTIQVRQYNYPIKSNLRISVYESVGSMVLAMLSLFNHSRS